MAEHLPLTPSSLDLTISIPGYSSGEGRAMRNNLDINRIPVEEEEDDEYDDGAGGSSPPRKKLRLSKEQSRQLEDSFRRNHTLNHKQKEDLATHLKLKARQVEVWFQNRRARSKLKQTEMECGYLKRWFASLTERNRRLQKEVEQLRALKASGSAAQCPASTLTMCPRCQRAADANQPATATLATHVAVSPKLPDQRSKLLPATTRQSSSAAC